MKLISPQEYSELRSELLEFVVLCRKYDYRPKESDFHEIIKFLLLNSQPAASMSPLCESFEKNPSYITNHMFNSLLEDLKLIEENEFTVKSEREFEEFSLMEYVAFKGDSEYDNKKDFDSAVGIVQTGAMVAGGAALAGVATAGMYVQYLFKKGKLKKMVQKELDAELAKLEPYKKLAQMKQQAKDLSDKLPKDKQKEVSLSVEYPSMAEGPELEPVPEPNK